MNPQILTRLGGRARDEAHSLLLAKRSGLLGILPPATVAGAASSVARHGVMGGLPGIAAARYKDREAIRDELGSVNFRELDQRSNALANAWRERGLAPGETVAILARNHRGFLYATFAAAKMGARIVLLNTDFAGPQLREVAGREGTDLLVYDAEYAAILDGVEPPRGAYLAWTDEPHPDSIESLIASASTSPPPRSGREPKIILLTSGTTGTPKGAPRAEPKSLTVLGALLAKVPMRVGEVTEIPAPMFHTLGFAHAMGAVAFGSTIVVRRRFDPAAVLASLAENRATGLVVVPVMLQRIVDLGEEAFADVDLSRLRWVFVAGSQLGADLCQRAMKALGPVVYNAYGSTEVAYATIATPEDLAVEPGCVGKPALGSVVKVLGDDGLEVAAGQVGRIFVGNLAQFEGYTGGGGKEVIDGLMSSGDVGHFDAEGRLFIDGRDDDMIVSGGENLFPGEVEELLAAHPAVREVSVLGVPDETFGQRLAAFVVRREGHELTTDQVKEHVKENLARFKTPREVVFVEALPRNPTGKVLKRELRAMV